MSQNKGTITIIAFFTLGILLLLSVYFLSFALTESKISKSQEAGTKVYYLAEAGINEAIWKLKNNTDWKNNFETDPNWSPNDFSSDFGGGSYTVTVKNLERGRAEISATSTIPVSGGKFAQRIVKTEVFRALGSITDDSAVFTGGASKNIEIVDSHITVYDGNLYCSNVLNIKGESIVKVYDNLETEDPDPEDDIIENLEGKVLVGKNIHGQEKITESTAICAKNVCTANCVLLGWDCPAEVIEQLPWVDFHEDAENSFKARAQAVEDAGNCSILCNGYPCVHPSDKCIYSASEFEDLLSEIGQGETLTLDNEVTYVTGNIRLRGNRNLTVNGILVSDGNIDIGREGEESSHVIINQPSDTSSSGFLSQGRITFSYASFDITGVIYSLQSLTIENDQDTSNITGATLARKLNFLNIGQLNITLDNDIIRYGLGHIIDGETIGQPEFLPTVIIDYWEESY